MACKVELAFFRASERILSGRAPSPIQLNNVGILHTRCYARPKSRTLNKEEFQAYNRFKSHLRSCRVALQKELKAQQESMEDFSAKAAEEDRQEKEAEEKALEANRIELERMKRKR